HLPLRVKNPHAPDVGQPVLVVRRTGQQTELCPQHRRLIPRHHPPKGRPVPTLKTTVPVIAIHGQLPATPAANDQVIPPVSVHASSLQCASHWSDSPRQTPASDHHRSSICPRRSSPGSALEPPRRRAKSWPRYPACWAPGPSIAPPPAAPRSHSDTPRPPS